MENVYYHEMITAQNEVGRLRKENEKLSKERVQLQQQLQELVNEIFEQSTPEEECPCGGDCGCKGDDNVEIIIS